MNPSHSSMMLAALFLLALCAFAAEVEHSNDQASKFGCDSSTNVCKLYSFSFVNMTFPTKYNYFDYINE